MTKSEIPPRNSGRTKFSRLTQKAGHAALVLAFATGMGVLIGLCVGSIAWIFLMYGVYPE